MKKYFNERLMWPMVVCLLAAVLVLLGALQYRWSREVGEAASARMRESVSAAMARFMADFDRDLSTIPEHFAAASPSASFADYGELLASYRKTPHGALVKGVYRLRGDKLVRIPSDAKRGDEIAWPDNFEHFRMMIAAHGPEMHRGGGPPPPHDGPHPPEHWGPPRRPQQGARREMGGPWIFDPGVPGFIHPVFEQSPSGDSVSWTMIEVDPGALQQQIFPELARRYFGGPDGLEYDVAVIVGRNTRLFSTSPQFGLSDQAQADAQLPFFEPEGPAQRRPRGPGAPLQRERRFEAMALPGSGSDWHLLVKNRQGSVEAVVARLQRRNLGVSFGVLSLLAITMGIIILASRRAQRFAQLQVDFVAGVSHELRTPIAVIASAADNIEHGIVDDRTQLAKYGSAIKAQAKQLQQLVEQILTFAALRQGGQRYEMQLIEPAEIVRAALDATSVLAESAGIAVEREIAPGLPQVRGDLAALSRCVQNLVTNAIKYGGAARWIGVRARLIASRPQAIEISVQDYGIGIAKPELSRIFQPFYRSPQVTSAQIHGTGLGLALANSIAEAMGGNILVASEPGRGSTFTLLLPSAEPVAQESAGGVREAADPGTA